MSAALLVRVSVTVKYIIRYFSISLQIPGYVIATVIVEKSFWFTKISIKITLAAELNFFMLGIDNDIKRYNAVSCLKDGATNTHTLAY